jgi:hypothetical protein
MWVWIKRSGSFLVLGTLAAVKILLPVPSWCVDCEGSNFWGMDAKLIEHRTNSIAAMSIATFLLAGSFQFKFKWAIPPAFSIIDILTQHLAGIPWRSLRNNEGPFIVIFDLSAGYLLITLGTFCRVYFDRHRDGRSNEASS